ncbi:MAG: Phosphoenolpyruvate-protein phosphotransferase [Paracidovorax wautersii]|uniref:Phosphoenolpyruvate-protein phosphotransferase n=1 Tax=Paracidovorax wautersii TaxID=1177982 RepID=A0A7V8JNP3_9BURK|nr:MAG: Phosphoenolpyruvate-protein phosphotransferase [Paracidovorax wautersii]
MTIAIHGLAVSRGIAIGRAVLAAASHLDVAHYYIEPEQVGSEIRRVSAARNAVIEEITRLQAAMSRETPRDLVALLDVHLMLLQDEALALAIKGWIADRLYNAEWALVSQLDVLVRQFDEMDDPYLRERKADLEQVVERVLRTMRGAPSPVAPPAPQPSAAPRSGVAADALVLIAHDLSPADMLQFKHSVFSGFVTDVGGKTSHTAIVARSMDIPAVVGVRTAGELIKPDDCVIIDGDAGVVIVEPSEALLDEYHYKQRQGGVERQRLLRLKNTPAVTLDGQAIELLANIELPEDTRAARESGAAGVGLFRSEFLFMGRGGRALPDEAEQYEAYSQAVRGMQGLPVTIRTIDVGADKPLDHGFRDQPQHLNPALGLRAIRWCLAEPAMFVTQLRAILRAAVHGPVHLLIPMLAHAREIRQTLALIDQVRQQLVQQGIAHGPVRLGAMIEIPAAALVLGPFLKHFDFLSIGTNDLIQYTLAIDRADESVAHLYDPLHPAVLQLVASTIAAGRAAGKPVSVCGEMAGDVGMTRLLLGLGLRSFSMHPTQLLAVKQEILRSDITKVEPWARQVLAADDPQAAMKPAARDER